MHQIWKPLDSHNLWDFWFPRLRITVVLVSFDFNQFAEINHQKYFPFSWRGLRHRTSLSDMFRWLKKTYSYYFLIQSYVLWHPCNPRCLRVLLTAFYVTIYTIVWTLNGFRQPLAYYSGFSFFLLYFHFVLNIEDSELCYINNMMSVFVTWKTYPSNGRIYLGKFFFLLVPRVQLLVASIANFEMISNVPASRSMYCGVTFDLITAMQLTTYTHMHTCMRRIETFCLSFRHFENTNDEEGLAIVTLKRFLVFCRFSLHMREQDYRWV